jgi:adenylate cyclase
LNSARHERLGGSAPGGNHPVAQFIRKLLGVWGAWWQHRVSLGISLLVTLLALAIYLTTFVGERPTPIFDFINRLEMSTLDTRFQLRGAAHPDPRIVIVDVDQRSQEVLGRWPFPRNVFAEMLDALRGDGARVAVFDISFTEPDKTAQPLRAIRAQLEAQRKNGQRVSQQLLAEIKAEEQRYNYDEQFAQAIERFGNVVLGNFFFYTPADVKGISPATLDRYANLLAYFPYPQVRPTSSAHGRQSYLKVIENYQDLGMVPLGAQANTKVLTDALASRGATGFFNIQPDPDGVVRRALLALPYGRDPNRAYWDMYASIDVQAIRYYLGLSDNQVALDFGATGVAGLEFGPSLVVHPDSVARLMINYQGPMNSYKHVSIADVVNKSFPPGTFKGKIVLVGATATGIGDLRTTPYGGVDYPGVEIHANIIDTILNKKFLLHGANQAVVDLALILFFGIPLGIWLALSRPRWMVVAPLLLLAAFVVVNYFAFLRGWWLNFTVPAATLVANTGFVALYRVLVEEREKRKVRGAFQQYLSPEVIRILLQSPELVQPRKTEVTVMFSDVRDFTSISEKLDAQDLALLLNGYLTEMTKVLFRHRGTLDKYIGDAVMAFWGAPFEQPEHAREACSAALAMLEKLKDLQVHWRTRGQPVLRVGFGISTGAASVGNMGSSLRYGYTAMGDVVNLASRLEGLNKEYGTQIVLGETTYAEAANHEFLFRELDLIRVKGKKKPVAIYELLAGRDGAEELTELAKTFSEGLGCYRRRAWAEGIACFEKILARWPVDGPSRIFLARCQAYLSEAPPPDWDGVYVMTHK